LGTPQLISPEVGFIGGLQWLVSGMALALMYWSKLSKRFYEPEPAASEGENEAAADEDATAQGPR